MSKRPIVVLPGLAPGLTGTPAHARLVSSADGVLDGSRLLAEAAGSEGPAFDAVADRVAAHLDEAGLGEAVVVAEGYLATAALRLAARRPEQVSELVLAAPLGYSSPLSGGGCGRDALARAVRGLYSGRAADVHAALSVLGTVRGTDTLVERYVSATDERVRQAAALLAGMIEAGGFELTRRPDGDGLRDVRAPVTLVWGRDDGCAPLDSAFYLERRLRDAQLRVIPNVGHLVAEQWGEGFVRYVSAVLSGGAGVNGAVPGGGAPVDELVARKGA